jgi:hypothetical protein
MALFKRGTIVRPLASAFARIDFGKITAVQRLDRTIGGWLFTLAIAAQPSVTVWAKEVQAQQTPYGIQGTSERWAWDRISNGQEANFDEKCNAAQPHAPPSDVCRNLNAQFVVDMLTKKQWSEQIKTARIRLVGVSIKGDIDLTDADFSGRAFLIGSSVISGTFTLDNAKADQLSLVDSTVTGEVSAEHFTTGRDLDLSSSTFEWSVNLNGADIGGSVVMSNAKFNGSVDLTRVKTAADLKMSCTHAYIVDAHYANIGGDLDLPGFQFRKLDLYGATVQKNLKIGQPQSTSIDCSDERSVGQTELILENTQVGNLIDDPENQDPKEIFGDKLYLEGFSVSHLNNPHTPDWWGKLFELNQTYSPHPYQRIAAAFAASGDGDLANEIRYWGRWREFQQQYNNIDWRRAPLSSFLDAIAGFGIGILGAFAGFGIGIYSFFTVVIWVAVLSFLSAIGLKMGSRASQHGFLWRWEASLFRLLPVVEIKEFKDFFDRELPIMRGCKRLWFLALSFLGWFLALVFVAAVSGITEKS